MDENKVLTEENISIIEGLVPMLQRIAKGGVLIDTNCYGKVTVVAITEDVCSCFPSTQEIFYDADWDAYEAYNKGIHYRVVL